MAESHRREKTSITFRTSPEIRRKLVALQRRYQKAEPERLVTMREVLVKLISSACEKVA